MYTLLLTILVFILIAVINRVFVETQANRLIIVRVGMLILIIGIAFINFYPNENESKEENSPIVYIDTSSVDVPIIPLTTEELRKLVKVEYEGMNEDLGGFTRPPNVSKTGLIDLLSKVEGSIYENRVKKSIDSLDAEMDVNIKKNGYKTEKARVSYINTDDSANPCIISKDFIKNDLYNPSTADFSSFDCTTERNSDGTYTIMRKVAAKNSLGAEREYIYKLKLGFIGGNWVDINNWKLLNIRSQEYK